MMKSSKVLLILLVFVSPLLLASGQERRRIPAFNECDDKKNKEKVKLFFSKVDEEITKLIDAYPQLADWKEKLEDTDQQITGKKITDNELIYWHSRVKNRPSGYQNWFEDNGCLILISVNTECVMYRLQGRGDKTPIFGLKMGDRYIVATVITGKPEAPELEKKIPEIIRQQASEVDKIWDK